MAITPELQHQPLATCNQGADPADFAHGVFHVIGESDDMTGIDYQLGAGLHGNLLDGAVGVKEDGAISTL